MLVFKAVEIFRRLINEMFLSPLSTEPMYVLDITAKVYHHFSAKFTTDMDLL